MARTAKNGTEPRRAKASKTPRGYVDAHTHRYPPEIFADPVGWARARGETHWAELAGPRPDGKRTLQGWADGRQMLKAMDDAGVEQAALLGWYWEKHETCVWHNAWMARWIKEAPERFSAFASVQPKAGSAALEDLKRARDAGFRGVGEVFPAAQGFALEHRGWEKILAWAAEEKLPVNLHVPEPAGPDYPGYIAVPLRDYQKLARRHPAVTFIFAHWGGLLPFYEMNTAARKDLRNVYYDTAASPLLYDAEIYSRVADVIGAERILFGSDYPLRVFPREQKDPDFHRSVAEVTGAKLSPLAKASILGGNARRVLGLK